MINIGREATVMSDIRFLLKFGQKEHMENLVAGNLYCSNAQTFWGIEDNMKIRGQGDVLEASTVVYAQSMTMCDPATHEVLTQINNQTRCIARVDPAKKMPVFCLFAVFDEDCELGEDGKIRIKLSEKTKNTIRTHFPNADSVVIIDNPNNFIENVKASIGREIKSELVHYFHIDEGFPAENGQTAMDMEYMKYVTQDVPPVVEDGRKTYSFYGDFAYRVLFCKDVFFKDEQEFRFVMPEEHISVGTNYPVNLRDTYKIEELESFMREH